MGCTPSIQDNTEVTETSQEDAQKIVERVYSAKKGRFKHGGHGIQAPKRDS